MCVCVSFDVCVYVFRSELISRMETTRECTGPMPAGWLAVAWITHPTNHPTQRVVMETGRDIYIGSRTRAPELFNRSAIERDGRRVEESNLGRQQSAQVRVGRTEKLHWDSSHFLFSFSSPFVYVFLSFSRSPVSNITVSRRPIYSITTCEITATTTIQGPTKLEN